jgi:CheY-like chemotaxis protein
MGGSIGVQDRPEGGSRFWFELPAVRATESQRPAGNDAPADPLFGRVLLVDDHPMNLRLGETLLPEETQRYSAEIKALVLAKNNEDALARAGEFWILASATLAAALAEPKKARLALIDEITVTDAHEMAMLLAAAPSVLKIHALMPAPAPMTDELLWELRAIYDELVASQPDAAPYVAVVALNRLSRPWEGLRLPLSIARQHSDTLISKTDMGLVGEILFDRLDSLQTTILTVRHPQFDTDTLLLQVKQFAELSAAIVKEIEVRRDGEWGQRLLKDRVAVGEMMEKMMERAVKELAVALPVQRGTGRTADFSKPIDAEKRALAMRYVRLVVGSRNFAAAASCGAKQKDIYEELCGVLRRYNEDVVRELRTPDAAGVVETQYQYATELTALLFSEEEAELLRRRGRAELAAAA